MKKFFYSFLLFPFLCQMLNAQAGKVGINTASPLAMLHVKDSSVLFTAATSLPGSPGNPPVSGAGNRFMWYPNKAAFRSGAALGTEWNRDSIGIYSTAVGYGPKAKGPFSFAGGEFSIASGSRAFAYGNGNIASGNSSIAMGSTNVASGLYSAAFNHNCEATGNYSIAYGRDCTASGESSTAIGYGTNAIGIRSTSLGSQVYAHGIASLATGSQTVALGQASLSGGIFSRSSGDYSFSFGFSTNAKSYSSLAVGMYNDTSSSSSTNWVSTDPLFIVGKGTSNSSRSNALTVLKNGNVGIGITNPGFLLNFPNSLGDKISLWGNSGTHYGFGIQSNTFQIHTDVQASDVVFGYGTSAALTETMRIKGNGNVGIGINNPAYKLDVFGRMRLRHGADGSPGIWFNKSDNTVPIAFMGLLNNEYIGLYGEQGSAWNFVMSTITGNVGIGLQSPTHKLHVNGNGLISGAFTARLGSSGATANGNAVGIFENNSTAYLNILTPNANESGLLFGNVTSSVHGGILYNTSANPNGMQFRTNGNVNRMVLTNSGALGVGTTAPTSKLHIKNGNSNADLFSTDIATFENNGDTRINLAASTGNDAGIRFNHPTDSAGIYFNKGSVVNGLRFEVGDNSVALVIADNGQVGIGTSNPQHQLHCSSGARFGAVGVGLDPTSGLRVSGNGSFTGTVTASCGVLSCSDMRYKTNIHPLTNSLSNVLSLNGVYYHWNKEKFANKEFTDDRQIGIIAQELEKFYPEMVHTDEDGFKTVDYTRLSPILLEAIKEQQVMIEVQQAINQEQQSKIDALTEELSIIKQMISTLKEGNQ